MQRLPSSAWVFAGAGLSIGVPLLGSAVAEAVFGDAGFPQLPLHSLVESAGGLMAIAIAGILVVERARRQESDHYVWMACALIGMGVLDLFHAAVDEGNRFVWLHSTATFVGGLLFACVWLPGRLVRDKVGLRLPWFVLVASILFGVASCVWSQLPDMARERSFTPLARGLNMGGGIGFVIAGVFFIRRYHRNRLETDWLFAVHTMLFGAAGVLFETSSLWDASWWWWHVLRLLAYMAAFAFAVGAYLSAELAVISLNHALTELNRELDQTVESRTMDLRNSEERYALAVRGSTDGLWDWNLVSDEVYYSPRFKELLGYNLDEFVHRFATFESSLHPDDVTQTMQAVQAHLEKRQPYDVEYRLKTKSGDYRWFRARGQAIWNAEGKPTRMAGSITDITNRKLAEASLKHERFLFQTLFEHLPDAIYFKDTEGRFTRATESLAKSLGCDKAQDLVGKTDFDFFPDAYAIEAQADEARLMETGEPLIGKEEHPLWGDQKECWVSTTKVPLRDEFGNIVGTFGVSHDITEQKLALERFRRVIEAAPNAMIVVNAVGHIQFANAATEQMFGYAREELVGQSVELLVPARLRDEHVGLRRGYMEGPSGRSMGPGRELAGMKKDGNCFPIEVGLSPIELEGETVVLSSIYDATQRKEAEEALVTAKEAAESASRAKSDFLANMSHEIRTPMNAIIGMTELLLESNLNRSQSDYLTVVLESAESLLAIINQILDFSKIEAGRLELECSDFDLYEVVGDTLKVLGHRAHAKQLELAWAIDDAVPQHVRGDAIRLRQILINLVGNAIKFTQEGEVVVRVACVPCQKDSVMLEFTVRDTGIGIPEQQRDIIFSAFEQADTSTTRQFGGTGLGLAISKRIVEAMGGKIGVDSAPGQGSRFHFSICLERGAPHEVDDVAEAADISGLPIVVVDDNQTNRRILSDLLGNWGMVVSSCETASDALDQLHQLLSHTDLEPILLSDVQMPGTDGFMLAEAVRADSSLQRIRIILLTSGGRSGDGARCRELDIDAHLMKPAKHSELYDAIAKAAGKQTTPRQRPTVKPIAPFPEIAPLRILLVEDGKANQMLAEKMLQKWGHGVTVAENGAEAIRKWEADNYDLILMDVQMPVMDGIEATRRIRQIEAETKKHVPIVAMTAHALVGDRDRCLDAGMDAYVAKPFRQHEVNRVLAELFPV